MISTVLILIRTMFSYKNNWSAFGIYFELNRVCYSRLLKVIRIRTASYLVCYSIVAACVEQPQRMRSVYSVCFAGRAVYLVLFLARLFIIVTGRVQRLRNSVNALIIEMKLASTTVIYDRINNSITQQTDDCFGNG